MVIRNAKAKDQLSMQAMLDPALLVVLGVEAVVVLVWPLSESVPTLSVFRSGPGVEIETLVDVPFGMENVFGITLCV